MAGFQNSSGNKLYANPSNSPLPATTAQSAPAPTANPSAGQYAAPSSSQQQTSLQHPTTPTSPAQSNSSSPTQTSSSSPNGQHHVGPARATPTLHSHSAFSPYHNSISAAHPTPVTTPTSSKPQLSQSHPPQEQSQPSTMMTTTSHIETTGSALIYPPHPTTHFTNAPFWPQPWAPLSNGTSAGTVALQGPGASPFMSTTVGYGATPSITQHTPRPKLTTTIWEDEGTLCYQVDARGICVARRQDNDMINGTKLLNVVGMSRGKRDGILKNEKGRVVVKVGAMHLKGVWITFQRAKTLAAQFKISDLLYPVFVDDPSIFLHNSYGAPITQTRIPSMGSQWRPHPFGAISNTAYTDASRPWYPAYSNGAMVPANAAPAQEHGASAYQHATTNGAHDDEYGSYVAQPQTAAGVMFQRSASYDVGSNTPATITANSTPRTGTPVYANVKTEETTGTPNGTGYYNRSGPGQLYNLVSAAEVVGSGSTPQSSSPQLIGQKRGYDDSESDDYSGNSQSSPPLAMHPPPLSNMAAVSTMNVNAAGSFPSPLNASPNSSPGSSAFSNWHTQHKRMKYEYPEATTPSSQQSSPRISG